MEGFFTASSFQHPAVDPATAYSFRYPSWVLLDKRAYFVDRDNATTARARTSTGHDVKVTFCLADPPSVSHFCVHCPQIDMEDYTTGHLVVSSAEDLVLLSFAFRTGPRSTAQDSDLLEYFVYKAAAASASGGGAPSIMPVPYSPQGTRHSCHAAILPRGDGSGNFLVADLSLGEVLAHYDLHVFSSETNEWRTTQLQLSAAADVPQQDLPRVTDKAIWLREGMVGWVDLWRGIVFCDVLEKDPVLGFIPLPTTEFNLHRTGQARPVRDVTCSNGFITFVEIEHCFRELSRSFKTTQDLDTEDVILVKDLFVHDDLDKREFVPDGWKIRTMFKAVSWDFWRKWHTVHVDEISANPEFSVQLPQLWNGRPTKWKLRNLKTTGFPTFGVHGADDVVYLMSKVYSDDDKDAWIVGVDLGKKTVQVIKPYCAPRAAYLDPTFIPCTFSEYLNTAPTPRPCAEEVAADCAQNVVLNDHLPSGDTTPAENCAQNGHLSSGYNVPDNVEPHQNTWNNGVTYYGSWNGYGYGTHPGYGNYQQSTPFQLQFIPPPNLPQPVQPMSSSTPTWVSGYIYAHWSDPDANGQMLMTVPLHDMCKLIPVTPPFAPPMPPMAAPPSFAQPPSW